jgi:hypothetical protein
MHMVFTHDDWEYADRYIAMNEGLSKANIYGWYHSHPGYGIFLSNRDRFIMQNFFNKPWNLSMVIDPVRRSFGLFSLSEGKPIKVQSFFLEVNYMLKNSNRIKVTLSTLTYISSIALGHLSKLS